MKKREFLKSLLLTPFIPYVSKAGILDVFKTKNKKSPLPPEGKFTPAKELFIVDIKGTPEKAKYYYENIDKYRLKIKGNIEKDLNLTFNEIKKLPFIINLAIALLLIVFGIAPMFITNNFEILLLWSPNF